MKPGTRVCGGLPHLMLAVACAEPLTAGDLLARVEQRYGVQNANAKTAYDAALRHLRQHRFSLAGYRQVRGLPSPLYVLTAAGEDLLDELAPLLWERLGGVA